MSTLRSVCSTAKPPSAFCERGHTHVRTRLVRRYASSMARSSSFAHVTASCLAGLLIAACGGKIEPGAADAPITNGPGAAPYGGTATANPIGSAAGVPPSSPAPPGAPGPSRSGTWVNGRLGFVVRDAISFDHGPSENRELRGIWLTGYANACSNSSWAEGSGVLRIDFSEQAGSVPPGVYPLEGPTPLDWKTAYAQVFWGTAAGCSTQGIPGAHFESGAVTITKSDAQGMVGSFQGVLVGDGQEAAIEGHFDARRCPGNGACQP